MKSGGDAKALLRRIIESAANLTLKVACYLEDCNQEQERMMREYGH